MNLRAILAAAPQAAWTSWQPGGELGEVEVVQPDRDFGVGAQFLAGIDANLVSLPVPDPSGEPGERPQTRP